MFMRLIAIAIALMVSCSTIVEGLANCQYNGLDFSDLANNTGSYSKTSSNGITYQWNICRISNECNALLQTTGIVSCQSSGSYGNYNTGKLENAKWSNLPGTGKGAMLTYLSGTTPCTSSKQQRQTQMQFQCGDNNGINIVTVEETSVNCIYEIVMTTKTACASSTTSTISTSSTTYQTTTTSTTGSSTTAGTTTATSSTTGNYNCSNFNYCSGHGACISDSCYCDQYYTGSDCQYYYPPTTGPTFTPIPNNGSSEDRYFDCSMSKNGMVVSSNQIVNCSSVGITICKLDDGSNVSVPSGGSINIITRGILDCKSDHIQCKSGYSSCSIDYPVFSIDGKQIDTIQDHPLSESSASLSSVPSTVTITLLIISLIQLLF